MKKNLEKVMKIAGKVGEHAKVLAAIAGSADEVRAKAEEIAARGKEVFKDVRKSVEEAVQEAANAALERAEQAITEAAEAPAGESGATETPAEPAEEKDAAEAAEPSEPNLSWCYGGFNGSKAKVSADAVLEQATLKGNVLSFTWTKGGCQQLGAKSKEDANHTVACLFLEDGSGGKFEWISQSRSTRETKNIKNGYNGWPKTALDRCGKLWFCIAGVKDDKATSNGLRTACVEVQR